MEHLIHQYGKDAAALLALAAGSWLGRKAIAWALRKAAGGVISGGARVLPGLAAIVSRACVWVLAHPAARAIVVANHKELDALIDSLDAFSASVSLTIMSVVRNAIDQAAGPAPTEPPKP